MRRPAHQRSREWWRLRSFAEEAHRRGRRLRHSDEPKFTGFVLSRQEWMVLLALKKGPLLVSDVTVPGVSVDWRTVGRLRRQGLVVRGSVEAWLTATGWARVERKW